MLAEYMAFYVERKQTYKTYKATVHVFNYQVIASWPRFCINMPRWDGLPDGPCPMNINNRMVKLSQGDLMLCPSCDASAFTDMSSNTVKNGSNTSSANIVGKKKLQSCQCPLLVKLHPYLPWPPDRSSHARYGNKVTVRVPPLLSKLWRAEWYQISPLRTYYYRNLRNPRNPQNPRNPLD